MSVSRQTKHARRRPARRPLDGDEAALARGVSDGAPERVNAASLVEHEAAARLMCVKSTSTKRRSDMSRLN